MNERKIKSQAFSRNFLAAIFVLCVFSPASAWDPNKPLIYEMRIAFETDNWTNHYSTTTVLSKSDNSVAFRVVANSTTTGAKYQLVVTTQGYVGIATESPAGLFTVGDGTMTVLSNGNVGIGTAAPVQKLDVKGGIHIAYTAQPLATCSTELRGTIVMTIVGSSSKQSLCLCRDSAAGYGGNLWQNVISGTVGTETTCPE